MCIYYNIYIYISNPLNDTLMHHIGIPLDPIVFHTTSYPACFSHSIITHYILIKVHNRPTYHADYVYIPEYLDY